MTGMTIGPYRLTGLIGQGGMGSVYSAEHTLLGRQAAIKVLHAEMSIKQDVVMRFFNEARAATAIRHPGIVEIYDFGWTPQNAAYIVMERLEGEALGERMAKARMAWPLVMSVARQIAGALSAAHAKGIVHRDLKPDNIYLVADAEVPGGERIKLLDFGIAKLAGDAIITGGNVTRTGAVMGTPTYMAPEQCRGVVVDHRADLYALGCIMFELCCGRPPFVGEGSGDVLAAHIHVPVPALGSLGAQVPPTVEAVIQNLLAKSPTDRVQSADALIQAIDRVLPERVQMLSGPQAVLARTEHSLPTAVVLPSNADGLTTLSGAASMSALPARNGRRWLIIGGGGVGAAAIAAVVVLAMRGGHGEDAAAHKVTYSEATSPAGKPAEPATSPAPVKPAVEVAKPAAEVAKPAVEVAKPAVEVAKPAVEVAKPAVEVAKPEPAKTEPPVEPAKTVAPAGTDVEIDSVPAGATVLLGGSVLGKTPLHTRVTRDGDATLLVRLPGYLDRSVAFHAGRAITEHLTLARPRRAAPPRNDRDQSVNPFGD